MPPERPASFIFVLLFQLMEEEDLARLCDLPTLPSAMAVNSVTNPNNLPQILNAPEPLSISI